MIFSIPFSVINANDDIQISISKATKVGQKIVREPGELRTADLSNNLIQEAHPQHSCLLKTDNNYFLLEGSVKVRYEWQDGDNFQDSDVETFRIESEKHPEHLRCNYQHGSGWMEGTAVLGDTPCDWKESPVTYEPDNSKTTLEIMEDGTRILCPMQYEKGWSFLKADVSPGASIAATKSGDKCYIVFGQNCSIGDQTITKNTVKKMTSASVTIKNESEKLCRLIKIYK